MGYKYTYQDWIEGILDTADLFDLEMSDEISPEDHSRISSERTAAYLKKLNIEFESLKKNFETDYKNSLLQEVYLDKRIESIKAKLDQIHNENPEIVEKALSKYTDGRYQLTKAQVDEYNAASIGNSSMSLIVYSIAHNVKFDLEESETFLYILSENFYKWLIWFKEQESIKKSEPKINGLNNTDDTDSLRYMIEISKRRNLSWENLFRDSKQADKVLNLIREHLSSTNQWLTEPKGRHIVALFLELKSKGYLKSDRAITNPVMAQAFTKQFGVDLVPENFQPKKSELADGYRENFQHIPHYKS